MATLAFDNDKYLQMQSAHIRDRIAQFGGKLYLEFGGKLYDDNHASRVLPGFQPDSKLKMLLELKDQAEVVIVINAADIDVNKMHLVEQLVGNCDSLDINILYGLTQNKRLTDLEDELFTTMNTIKYRIKKMCAITGTSSRDELKELATYFLS